MNRRKRLSLNAMLAVIFMLAPRVGRSAAAPVVSDSRLELSVFAAEPDIVTPIGMAIGPQNRIFVIESHTHQPPKDYTGPKTDRIKLFIDADNDGKPDSVRVFAEDLNAAMNLVIGPTGDLFVVCAREVWWLRDSDNDGVADSRARILKVETENDHAHSCLLGIALGPDNHLYVSRGNNGGMAWKIVGSDDSSVTGYGDGGNIIRCQPDGRNVEEFATGFWNPFDIRFDHLGRLLCVDNDPDARGPNRFLHVVRRGDYGYKSLFGGGGNHPYQAWEGELPGTLPMIAGTGEAPSGLVDCATAALPAGYRDQFLITSWNENAIHRYGTFTNGASIVATNGLLVSGGKDFRPVALATDTNGNIFFTDWVLVDYPNHGRGKIWRLRSTPGLTNTLPRSPYAPPETNLAALEFERVASLSATNNLETFATALADPDTFLRHAAVTALSGPDHGALRNKLARNENPTVRLGALLALHAANDQNAPSHARRFLSDTNVAIRTAALIWVGTRQMTSVKARLAQVLEQPVVTSRLFATYLATLEVLDPEFIRTFGERTKSRSGQIPRRLDDAVLVGLIENESLSASVRRLALARLGEPGQPAHRRLLLQLAGASNPILRMDAVRHLGEIVDPDITTVLRKVALKTNAPPAIRAEALLSLSRQSPGDWQDLLPLLDDADAGVRIEAARNLRLAIGVQIVKAAFEGKLGQIRTDTNQTALAEQLDYALRPPGGIGGPPVFNRPLNPEAWRTALTNGGDPIAGERLFRSPQTGCSRCHTVNQHGGVLGPDLSNIGQSADRARIIASILSPSEQFAPQYQAWFVETKDRDRYEGLQLDHKAEGAIELFTAEGKTRHFEGSEVADYGPLARSLMPEGLENTMTVHEFRDLIAFLSSLK